MELENKSVDQNEIDIVAIVRLLKRKWYVFLITMVAAFAVAAFYFLTKAPQYSTTATILIKTDDPMNPLQGMNFDGFIASDILGTTKAVDDEMEILRSKKLVKQMIDELGIRTAVLIVSPRFFGIPHPSFVLSTFQISLPPCPPDISETKNK